MIVDVETKVPLTIVSLNLHLILPVSLKLEPMANTVVLPWTGPSRALISNTCVGCVWCVVSVVGVLLVVEGELDSGRAEDVGRRGEDVELGGVDDLNWDFTETFEVEEGVVEVVDGLVDEGVEVASLDEDLGVTRIGTTVRDQLGDGGPVVVPVVNVVFGILLVVEGNREGDGFLHHI